MTKTGSTSRDFSLQLGGVTISSPHILTPGQTFSLRPEGSGTVYSEIDWGDGRVSFIPGGWQASTPSNLTSHSYANRGTYRVEYVTESADGARESRWLTVGVVAASEVLEPEQPAGCGAGGNLRVLFVGNSQIEVQNLPQIVSSIASSAPANCPRISVGTVALGGANLGDLWNAGQVQVALRSRNYDAVVIAESIDLADRGDARYPNDFYDYARRMVDLARSLGVTPILYATPNMITPFMEAGFADMATPNAVLGKTAGVTVATGGLAWYRAWASLPGLRLHDVDDSHPSYVGSVLSGYVLYAAITNASPIGLSANPFTDYCGSGCPVISASTAAVLQQAAWDEYLTNGRKASSGAVQRAPVRTIIRR